MFGSGSQT